MYSHGFIEELVCVLLLLAAASLGVGILMGSARRKRLLTRSGEVTTGAPDRLDTVLDEVRELRAQVADLTLMVDDARWENRR